MNPKTLLFSALLVVLIPIFAFSQIKDYSLNNVDLNKEYFYIEPLVFDAKDSLNGRLDLYIELPLENVQFKHNISTDKYDAFIDYFVTIKNSKGNVVYNNSYSETMSNTESEMKKISEKSVYAIKQYILHPDTYSLNFFLKDKNSQKEYSKDYEFKVSNFHKEKVSLSDIMLVSDYNETADGQKEITPLITRNVGNLKEFYIFFEVYNRGENLAETHYNYKIYDERNAIVMDGNYNYYLDTGVNKKVEKFSTKLFVTGKYRYELTDLKTNETVISKDFFYRWDFLPIDVKNLDLAISQLIYIANSKELKYIKNASTRVEKERRFLKFWNDKNPNPGSRKNTLMIEYYNRIRIANQRYSHYVDGWKTDMGMVFIIYGNPSNIERHPFESDSKPYEIWEYYDLRKRFVFLDDSGFGDYRLTTPIWDDEKNRIYY